MNADFLVPDLVMPQPSGYPKPPPGGTYDLAVIGGGPAGLTAGIYAARKRLKALLVSADIGGQMLWTSRIENYPGFNIVQARELVDKFRAQIGLFPLDVDPARRIDKVAADGARFRLEAGGGVAYTARSVIVATGKRYRSLGVPGEKELVGRGVAYCATCDAPLFQGRPVAVVGGGNSALTSANELLPYASKVYLVNSSDKIHGDPVLLEPLERSGKVELLMDARVEGIEGKDKVERVSLKAPGGRRDLEVSGVFVEIGLIPNSELVKGLAELSRDGEIMVDCSCRTSLPGLFAAGDVTTVPAKQIVVAAGEGAKAALAAYDWLLAHPA